MVQASDEMGHSCRIRGKDPDPRNTEEVEATEAGVGSVREGMEEKGNCVFSF